MAFLECLFLMNALRALKGVEGTALQPPRLRRVAFVCGVRRECPSLNCVAAESVRGCSEGRFNCCTLAVQHVRHEPSVRRRKVGYDDCTLK